MLAPLYPICTAFCVVPLACCGGNVKLTRIGGIVAVTWTWDPGGGVLGILAFVLLPAGTKLVLVVALSFHPPQQSIIISRERVHQRDRAE